MVNQVQWNKKAMKYILKQREKALSCTICKKKLFSHNQCIDEFIDKNYLKLITLIEVRRKIHGYIIENYEYHDSDGHLSRHHTNYKKGITIPVCDVCHGKIHHSKDHKFAKYLPVDERPKNNKKIVYNLYKPIKEV